MSKSTHPYETIKMGDLTNFPMKGNRVKVHYDVYLTKSDKKVESSREENEPFEFMVGRGEVLEIWEQVIPKMSLGEKVRIISSTDALLSNGESMIVGSMDKVIFIIELISFQ